jgi:hypothetical protein
MSPTSRGRASGRSARLLFAPEAPLTGDVPAPDNPQTLLAGRLFSARQPQDGGAEKIQAKSGVIWHAHFGLANTRRFQGFAIGVRRPTTPDTGGREDRDNSQELHG